MQTCPSKRREPPSWKEHTSFPAEILLERDELRELICLQRDDVMTGETPSDRLQRAETWEHHLSPAPAISIATGKGQGSEL